MQNPALTIGAYNLTLRSKASDGVFCKPLQALVLAIVVFFFFFGLAFTNVPSTSFNANGLVIPCKY